MVLTDMVAGLADLVTDLADMGPRLVVIAAAFLAPNMLAAAACDINPDSCGLAFITFNAIAIGVVWGMLRG